MQTNEKIFEVDQIICHRKNSKGADEYLVYWKGFDITTATWEPVENLLSCTDLIQQFQRVNNPIPGANPYTLSRTEKTKTVHVKMLMNKRRNNKRKTMPHKTSSKEASNIKKETNDKIKKKYNDDYIASKENIKKKLSEGEKLIRDTLLHEAKSFKPTNGIHERVTDLMNGFENNFQLNGFHPHSFTNMNKKSNSRNSKDLSKDHVLHKIKKGYMEICLNNTARHNLLTIGMLELIGDCLHKAKRSNEIKAVLLINKGDFFCSGIDYTELMHCHDDKDYKTTVSELISSLRSFLDTYLFFPKPIICAVRGHVLEFGVSLVVAADYAFTSSTKCTFDTIFGKMDMSPVGGLTGLLPMAVGLSKAKSIFHGGKFNSTTAYDLGLVLDMYGCNSFEEDIEKKMKSVTEISTHVHEKTKKLFDQVRNDSLSQTVENELSAYQQCLSNKECKRKIKEEWTTLINLYSGGVV